MRKAMDDDLHFTLEYVAAQERAETCIEIHKKHVGLNLQIMLVDQRLKQLIQDCSIYHNHNEALSLKMAVEQLTTDQESMKQSLHEFLVQFFKSNCSENLEGSECLENLGSSDLEQEVYMLMSTIETDQVLKVLMTKIEGFSRSVDQRNNEVSALRMEFDGASDYSKLAIWNLGQSGDEGPRSLQPPLFKDTSFDDLEKSLSDVAVEMYGFSPDVALEIQKSLASRELVSKEFKLKNNSRFRSLHREREGSDMLDKLNNQSVSENYEAEDAKKSSWKRVQIAKGNSEANVKMEICYDPAFKQNAVKSFKKMQMDSDSGYFDKKSEILAAYANKVFRVESLFCEVVHDFRPLMSGNTPAMTKFQDFTSGLKEMKEREDGKVPIIVYKVLAMPEIPNQEVGDRAVLIQKEIQHDQMIDTFQEVILLLGSVLKKTSGLRNEQTINMTMLSTSCEGSISKSKKLLIETRRKIHEAKSRLGGLQLESVTKK